MTSYTKEQIEMIIKENEKLKEENEKLKEKQEKDRLKKVKLRNDLEIANMLLIDDVISEKIDDSIEKGINEITIHTGRGFFKDKKIDYVKEYIIPYLLKNNSNEDERYSAFKNGYYYYKGHYTEQYEVEYNGDDTLFFDRVETEEEEEEEEESEEEDTIEIHVMGWGFCRYKNKEEMLKEVVHCKNDCWKMKGDKKVRDLEGNYCETSSEEEETSEEESEEEEV